MSKVLLISPPSWGLMLSMTTPAPPPPLGLVIIQRILESEGHDVLLLDTGVVSIDLLGIQQIIREYKPDIIGITTYFQNPAIYHFAETSRRICPEALIILGGVIAMKCYEDILNLDQGLIDVVITGNGLEEIRYLARISGTRKEAHKQLCQSNDFIKVKNGFFSKLDTQTVKYQGNQYLGAISPVVYKQLHYVFQSGCPYNCSFCISSNSKNNMVFELESMVKEINDIYDVYGNSLFMLFDETTTYSKDRIQKFAQLIKNAERRLSFWCGTRSDCIDDEVIDALNEIGVKRIFIGVESTKASSQKYVGNKCRDITKVKEKVAKLKSYGIKTESSILLGLPFETKEDFLKSVYECMELGIENIMFNIVSILPTTGLYKNCEELGYTRLGTPSTLSEYFDQKLFQVTGKRFFRHNYINPDDFESIINTTLKTLNYDDFDGRQISFRKKVVFRLPY